MTAKKTLPMPVRYGINTALIVLSIILGNMLMNSGIIGNAQSAVVIQIGVYMILAVSLNVATGYLGQLPLGHAGFMAVGGYTAAIFWKSSALPAGVPSIIVGLLLAGTLAALFGVAIGIPSLRLRGDYLAIITLGFGEIIRVAIINLPSITNGTPGLKNIPKYSNFVLVYICVAITCIVIHMVMKSRHGRAIFSIRENEIAAEACGINTTYYKVMAFTLSAFFAGVAGALYAGNIGVLAPKNFGFMMSIDILIMVVLGGMGSMLGSIIAAALLTALPLMLQSLSEWRMIIYSVALIAVMIFKPSGLMGKYDFSLSRIIEKLMNRSARKNGGAY